MSSTEVLRCEEAPDRAAVLLKRVFVTIADIANLLEQGSTILVAVDDRISNKRISNIHHHSKNGFGLAFAANEIEFGDLVIEAWDPKGAGEVFYEVSENPESVGFLGCLARLMQTRGRLLATEFEEQTLVGKYIGAPSLRDGLESPSKLIADAIRLSLAS